MRLFELIRWGWHKPPHVIVRWMMRSDLEAMKSKRDA